MSTIKTLFMAALCSVFVSFGVSYYIYPTIYKLNVRQTVDVNKDENKSVLSTIERDVIMAVKNDIGDGKDSELVTIRTQIERIVQNSIKAHPEVIVESIAKYYRDQQIEQQKKAEQKAKDFANNLQKHGTKNPVYGAVNPKIRVVEFFDYSCGYCKKMLHVCKSVAEKYPDIQFVFMEFPMYPPSKEASRAAIAVNMIAPSKYIAFQEKVFGFDGEKTRENMEKIATELGVDVELFKKIVEDQSGDIQKIWDDNRKSIEQIGITGTPTLIVGEQLVPGFIGLQEFDNLLTEIYNASKKEANVAHVSGKINTSDTASKGSSTPTAEDGGNHKDNLKNEKK